MKKIFGALAALLTISTLTSCSDSSYSEVPNLNSDSIMNGLEVSNSTFARESVVLVFGLDKTTNKRKYICSGTLIDKDIVLTAAHCKPEADQVAGISFALDADKITSAPYFKALRFIIPPGYTGDPSDPNDIALIQFKGDLPSYMKPHTLPDPKRRFPNSPFLIAGYGNYTPYSGAGVLRLMTFDPDRLLIQGPSNLIFNQNGNVGICQGDSGGPLFAHPSDNELYLIGVTSFSIDIPHPCFAGGFVDIRPHSAWIQKSITELHASE